MKMIIYPLLLLVATYAQAGMNHISIQTNLFGKEVTKVEFQTSSQHISTVLKSEETGETIKLHIEVVESDGTGEIKLITSYSASSENEWFGFSELEAILKKEAKLRYTSRTRSTSQLP